MKYSIEKLITQINQGEKIKYLFFWGHRPSKDGSVIKSCLSQWWEQSFTVDRTEYKSAEHWMMAEKARLFKDQEMWETIVVSKTPGEAKKLGRQISNFDPKVWDDNKFQIVVEGNVHKFNLNEDLKTFLLNTKDRVLVEASPPDNIWGIGMDQNHKDINNPEKWKGQNLLGFALMEVRDQLTS